MTLRIKGATTIKGLTSVNWSPNLLFAAGEQGVWYDPSDFSTMFQDTAGTTPVTATGQSVARINDKSGNNNHATQSTAANRPTLQIDGNGKYYLLFDGSNDGLATGSINFSSSTAFSSWAGLRKLADGAYGCVAELSSNASANTGFGIWAPGWNSTGAVFGSEWRGSSSATYGNCDTSTSYAAPVTAVFTVVADMTQATLAGQVVAFNINGAAVTQNRTGGAASGNFGTSPLYIGARNQSSLFFNGYLYGLIIRGAASSASQIAMTETYMNSKTAAY